MGEIIKFPRKPKKEEKEKTFIFKPKEDSLNITKILGTSFKRDHTKNVDFIIFLDKLILSLENKHTLLLETEKMSVYRSQKDDNTIKALKMKKLDFLEHYASIFGVRGKKGLEFVDLFLKMMHKEKELNRKNRNNFHFFITYTLDFFTDKESKAYAFELMKFVYEKYKNNIINKHLPLFFYYYREYFISIKRTIKEEKQKKALFANLMTYYKEMYVRDFYKENILLVQSLAGNIDYFNYLLRLFDNLYIKDKAAANHVFFTHCFFFPHFRFYSEFEKKIFFNLLKTHSEEKYDDEWAWAYALYDKIKHNRSYYDRLVEELFLEASNKKYKIEFVVNEIINIVEDFYSS